MQSQRADISEHWVDPLKRWEVFQDICPVGKTATKNQHQSLVIVEVFGIIMWKFTTSYASLVHDIWAITPTKSGARCVTRIHTYTVYAFFLSLFQSRQHLSHVSLVTGSACCACLPQMNGSRLGNNVWIYMYITFLSSNPWGLRSYCATILY